MSNVQNMFGGIDKLEETHTDGDKRITCHAATGVTGRRLVKVVAGGRDGLPYIGPYDGTGIPFGAAIRTVPAGERVGVVGLGNVPKLEAGAAIAGGDPVKGGADGRLVPFVLGTDAAHLLVGVASHDAAVGETVQTHRGI